MGTELKSLCTCLFPARCMPACLLIAGLIVLPYLSGCREETSTPAQPQKQQAGNAASIKIEEFKKRLDRLLVPSPYKYSSAGKPEPFQPFLRTTQPEASLNSPIQGPDPQSAQEKCTNTLECLDVGQLKIVAIITRQDKSRVAMAQDAAGLGYVLAPGTMIGYRKGRIQEILPDRIIISEEAEDIHGGTITQERHLLLHPEE